MNRIEIKEKAKTIVKEKFKDFWKGYLIIIAISFLLSIAIELLCKRGTAIYSSLTIISSFFTSTLSVGFYGYLLKMIRNEEYSREDIFKHVGNILPIVTMTLLVGIICFLWCILLIIPGIIAALSYSMVYYIYAENQELLPMEYLGKSKEMMNGYKKDYFIFTLSFLGWILLCLATLGIALIYVIPYITISETIYYEELKKIKEKN